MVREGVCLAMATWGSRLEVDVVAFLLYGFLVHNIIFLDAFTDSTLAATISHVAISIL